MEQGPASYGLFAGEGLSALAERRLVRLADGAGAFVALIGLAGVAGWAFDIPVLRTLTPGVPAVRPLSALCLALLGGSLWSWPRREGLSSALAGVALAVASLSLFDALAPVETAMRHLVVDDRLLTVTQPEISERIGLTTPFAAIGYGALALGLLVSRTSAFVGAAQALAISVLFNALVPVLGYLYRIESLSSPLLSSAPSLQGAGGIALLAIGILCRTPQRGVIGILAGNTAGSRAARRLLIPALGLPMLLGGIFLYVRAAGSLDLDAAVPTFVCALAATLGASVLWVARSDARLEILQRRGEEAIRAGADESPLMMWMADGTGKCSHMNPAALAFIGTTLEEVLGGGWQRFAHPDDLSSVVVEIAVALQGRRVLSAEFRVRHRDGDWRWILANGVPRLSPTQNLPASPAPGSTSRPARTPNTTCTASRPSSSSASTNAPRH